jgi:4-oxalmesaconate hydratase
VIIDCHGHYTTAPEALQTFRAAQIAGLSDASLPSPLEPNISDDEIRTSLENAQLKFSRERGTDVTIFSPRRWRIISERKPPASPGRAPATI